MVVVYSLFYMSKDKGILSKKLLQGNALTAPMHIMLPLALAMLSLPHREDDVSATTYSPTRVVNFHLLKGEEQFSEMLFKIGI